MTLDDSSDKVMPSSVKGIGRQQLENVLRSQRLRAKNRPFVWPTHRNGEKY